MTLAVWALVLVGLVAYVLFLGERRVALAFAFAPLTAPLIGTLQSLDVRTFLLMTVFSYPLSLLLGVPAYLVFRRFGRLQLWWVVPACAALGGAAQLLLFGTPNYNGAARSIVTFCGLGAATGLVFWGLAFASLRSNNRWRGP